MKTFIDEKALREAYIGQHLSSKQTALLFGCTKKTILHRLARYNIPRHTKLSFSKVEPKAKEIIHKYVNKLVSSTRLAKEYEVSHEIILRLLKRHGVYVRKRTCEAFDLTIPKEDWKLAYIAGLVDGEGSVSFGGTHKGKFRFPFVTITNTNKNVIDWVASTLGGNIVVHHMKNHKWKTCYKWYTTKTYNVLFLLRVLLPYLIVKKANAEKVIHFCQERIMPSNISEKREFN